MTSDRPTVPRMFFSFRGRNWPGRGTHAASRPSSGARRSAPRARFRAEELEARWLLSMTEVSWKPAETVVLGSDDTGSLVISDLDPDKQLTALNGANGGPAD